MGFTTDIIGQAEIEPPLNPAEIEYLQAFAESRRWCRPDGPYAVPANPLLDERRCGTVPRDRFDRPPVGQPSLWCDWVPACGGGCLAYDGHERFYEPARWMRYLIDHFLAPGGRAARSGAPVFEEFTFDHTVNGVLAARRRDTGRLWLIRIRANAVREQTLVPGVEDADDNGALPYEAEIDGLLAVRRRRRRLTCPDGREIPDLVYRRPA